MVNGPGRPRKGEDLVIRYETRGDKVYAYQSTSTSVNGKKKTVNTYLGRVDPETKELLPKTRPPRSKGKDAKIAQENTILQPDGPYIGEYGGTYLLHLVQTKSGLGEDLCRSFGPAGKTILAIAMAMTLSRPIFAGVEDTMERTWIRQFYDIRMSMDSGSLSDFTQLVGTASRSRADFWGRRIKRCNGVILFDTTTRGTYSELQGMAEWLAKDAAKEDPDLRQVKTGTACDMRSVPVYSHHYPGSYSDLMTLSLLQQEIKGYGIEDIRVVADRGMMSSLNVEDLIVEGLDFVMPGKFGSSAFDRMLQMFRNPKKTKRMVHRDHAYKVMESEIGLKPVRNRRSVDGRTAYEFTLPKDTDHGIDGKAVAFLCYDSRLASDQIQTLDLAVERLISKAEGIDSNHPVFDFEQMAGPYLKFFSVTAKDRGVELEVREDKMNEEHARDGFFLMIASAGTTWADMMCYYDARRGVEQCYDTMKGEDRRFRSGDKVSVAGREFIKEVSWILLCEVRALLSDHRERFSNDGARIVLDAMGCMMATEGRMIKTPSKARRILEEFGMEVPKTPMMNVRCCDFESTFDAPEDSRGNYHT